MNESIDVRRLQHERREEPDDVGVGAATGEQAALEQGRGDLARRPRGAQAEQKAPPLNGLDGPHREYVEFHLDVIACPYCQANLEDLEMDDKNDQDELKARVEQAREDSMASSGTYLEQMRRGSGSA